MIAYDCEIPLYVLLGAWEEFIAHVMGGIKQNCELINSAVEETRNGMHIIYPKMI